MAEADWQNHQAGQVASQLGSIAEVVGDRLLLVRASYQDWPDSVASAAEDLASIVPGLGIATVGPSEAIASAATVAGHLQPVTAFAVDPLVLAAAPIVPKAVA